MSKHHPEMDKVSYETLCFLFWWKEGPVSLSSAVPRRDASFQVECAVVTVFIQKSVLVKAMCMDAKLTVGSSGSSSNHCSCYQTGNYISQNLLSCRACRIKICQREELLEGRSKAEAIFLRISQQ